MAYDEGLAERLRDQFRGQMGIEEKKMFGGLCFMVANHMCLGVMGETVMARVGPEKYEECLQKPHAREMDFTGRAMKGMIYVSPDGLQEEDDLAYWVGVCQDFVDTLPPRLPGSGYVVIPARRNK